MELVEKICQISDELEQHTIEIRRQIHQNPELSYKELQTSALVRRELERMGVPYEESPVKPGIIAAIDSGKPGKFLMLRADMDALPIQEETDLEFASRNPNVMHACGHDVHTANLLAVAEILNRTREDWKGKVKLVFQPAEESGGGGREMIKAGLMEEMPDACFALHVDNTEAGQVLIGKGYLTAYSDGYLMTVHGKAAHSSTSEEGVDAIDIAASIITALHGIDSRNLGPMAQGTLNVGTIKGGLAGNIIADKVDMVCMMRSLSDKSRDTMRERIAALAQGIAQAKGGSCDCEFRAGYAAVYNNEEFSEEVYRALSKYESALYQGPLAGARSRVKIGSYPMLAAEDFGFYSQKVPSCLVWVGVGEGAPKHNSHFSVNEDCIKFCTRVMVLTALEYLNR